MKHTTNKLPELLIVSLMAILMFIGIISLPQIVYANDSENTGTTIKKVTLSNIQVGLVNKSAVFKTYKISSCQ